MLKQLLVILLILYLSQASLTNLDQKSFLDFKLKSSKTLIVYHKNDRISQRFLGSVNQLEEGLQSVKINVQIGAVNCKEQEDFCKSLSVGDLPAVYLYEGHGKQQTRHKGYLTNDEIVNWLKIHLKYRKSTTKPVESIEALENRLYKQNDLVVFVGEDDDSEEFSVYQTLAGSKSEFIFLHSFTENMRKRFNVKKGSAKIISVNVGENKFGQNHYNEYKGDLKNVQAITHFLKTYYFRGFRFINQQSFDELKSEKLPTLILAVSQLYNGHNLYNMTGFEGAFRSLREHFYNKAILGVVNATDPYESHLFYSELRIDKEQIPALGYFDFSKPIPLKIPYTGKNITIEVMKSFFEEANSGKLEGIYNSEEPLTDGELESLLVKRYCRKDWDKYVKNNDQQDVVVFFYYLGCAECVAQRELFWRVAYRLKNNPNLVFARLDVQRNDVEGLDVQSFPHFKLYRAGKYDKPVRIMYQDTPKKFIQYIEPLVTKPWVEPIPDSEVKQGAYKYEKLKGEIEYEEEQARINKIQMERFQQSQQQRPNTPPQENQQQAQNENQQQNEQVQNQQNNNEQQPNNQQQDNQEQKDNKKSDL